MHLFQLTRKPWNKNLAFQANDAKVKSAVINATYQAALCKINVSITVCTDYITVTTCESTIKHYTQTLSEMFNVPDMRQCWQDSRQFICSPCACLCLCRPDDLIWFLFSTACGWQARSSVGMTDSC